MLDTETKRRIDSARDILVGKVPDPKSQVEQITIALIYKFMDDMDKESIEFGGNASFFSGEYAKYRWSNIFDPRLGGYDMLNLYSEAILKLNINPNIPQLFRDIFKNAYLPYRDPETLKLFLKTINEFTYDHSERLGDAFEYLLSVLSSQGDAGQFRTPRHIIDFIVEVLDPKKNETVLDPACGTAGFLISSYKHIVEQNTKPKPNPEQNGKSRGDMLTPSDRKSMMQNFAGYDISPDMVRLSLVNMYLHNFTTPKIYEYDTLTSEDRWGEYFDIIMANPPFMSPKGGIKPHRKFTMQANRSEVLFVDYIAEHINPIHGRAGVIVPEGIIFQSANAYKSLRKLLVEKNFLYAVVSLPAGIFQPYSGVKTSILFMDKNIAKKTDKILFIKAENDGYSLGAQRKEIEKNDLTAALQAITYYKLLISQGKLVTSEELVEAVTAGNEILNSQISIVSKDIIARNGDFNLSIDRYRINDDLRKIKYEMVELGEVCDICNGSTPLRSKEEFWNNGTINWFTVDDIREQGRVIRSTIQKITQEGFENSSVKLLPKDSVLLCCTASVGEYAITEIELTTNQQFNGLIIKDSFKQKLMPKFLFFISSTFTEELIRLSGKTSFNFVSVGTLKTIQIPLPPLSIQKEIVAKIEKYQKIIDGAKQITANYKPQIDIDPDWEMVKLGEVSEFKNGLNFSKESKGEKIKILGVSHFKDNLIAPLSELDEIQVNQIINDSYLLKKGDIVFVRSNGNPELVGRSVVIPEVNERISFSGFTIRCRIKKDIEPLYLGYLLKSEFHRQLMKNTGRGANIRNLSQEILNDITIPITKYETQKKIVDELNNEQQLVNASKELIKIFEQKIKDEINKLWE